MKCWGELVIFLSHLCKCKFESSHQVECDWVGLEVVPQLSTRGPQMFELIIRFLFFLFIFFYLFFLTNSHHTKYCLCFIYYCLSLFIVFFFFYGETYNLIIFLKAPLLYSISLHVPQTFARYCVYVSQIKLLFFPVSRKVAPNFEKASTRRSILQFSDLPVHFTSTHFTFYANISMRNT